MPAMVPTVRLYVASAAAVCAACLALWACTGDPSPSCEVPVGLNPQQLPPRFCPLNPQQLPPGETPSQDASAGAASVDGGSAEASAADASPDAFDASSGDAPEDSPIDGEGDASFREDGH